MLDIETNSYPTPEDLNFRIILCRAAIIAEIVSIPFIGFLPALGLILITGSLDLDASQKLKEPKQDQT